MNSHHENVVALMAENARFREGLIEIRDHWANQYDHPRKLAHAMYAGPYGIGVTDGHRLCASIARKALGENIAP